jgi:SAM-dependent methyltransferase
MLKPNRLMNNTYYHTKESVSEYIQLAKDVDSKSLIKLFANHMETHSKVLEIGSGPGTDWNILNGLFHVIGSDQSKLFVEHLQESFPNGDFLELDAVTLDTSLLFDGIYSNKVLHHLSDDELVQSLHRQYEILKPGGIICHSFWKGEGTETFKGMFVNYHTSKALQNLFQEKYTVLMLKNYQEFEEDDSLVVIAMKI